MNTPIYFFIGTEAELIKMSPTIAHLKNRGIEFKIISSGQNNISNSVMLQYLDEKVDIYLTTKQVYQTPLGLIKWFCSTIFNGYFILKKVFLDQANPNTWLVIHGDTVSSMLGGIIGRIIGFKVAHVEAGYKSNNILHPFPEELDRTIASLMSDVLFCPFDSIGKKNIMKGKLNIDIGLNTSIDSLYLALKTKVKSPLLSKMMGKRFFIFALHRQETLINKKLFIRLIRMLIKLDTNLYCIFALHNPTKKLLEDLNIMKELESNKKILLTPRLSYFEYIHVLNKSEFIMTDGVGNQQETYYLGKPCLILRYLTEGFEGLNSNAVLSKNSTIRIMRFVKNYKKYCKKPLNLVKSPSKIIADQLLNLVLNNTKVR